MSVGRDDRVCVFIDLLVGMTLDGVPVEDAEPLEPEVIRRINEEMERRRSVALESAREMGCG